jgi:tRNA (Thr-GGU) A37 N-methylase
VELVSVQGDLVTVRDLDAIDGTPVLDIKPCEDNVVY